MVFGWLLALIVSTIVRSLLKRTDLDNKIVHWVTGTKAPDVEQGIGKVVFWLIMILVLIAYMVGKVIAGLITDLLTGMGFNAILKHLGIGSEPKEGECTPSEIVGYLGLVAIMLSAIFEASSLLGFEALSEVMKELTLLGGYIILGVVLFGLGLYLANLASSTIKASGAAQADMLSGVARIAIILLAGSIALRYTGLANEIISLAFGLILGAIALALAIAFGIGGRDVAARKIEEWTSQKKQDNLEI